MRRLDSAQRKSKGGLILPDSARDGMELAEILRVGPGLWNEETGKRIPTDCEEGEIVLLPLHAMHPNAQINAGGEPLFIVPAPEVCASVDGDAKSTGVALTGVGIGIGATR